MIFCDFSFISNVFIKIHEYSNLNFFISNNIKGKSTISYIALISS